MTHYAQFVKHYSWRRRLRALLRDTALFFLSLPADMARKGAAVRFTSYHHVFDDERLAFARQLKYLKNYWEFISLEHAVQMVRGELPIDGQYYCMTFDDGYRNCLSNALPILQEQQCVATFFVVTALVDAVTALQAEQGRDAPLVGRAETEMLERILGFTPGRDGPTVPFLNWAECRQLQEAGMTVASHTRSHRNLSLLAVQEVRQEMRRSRADILQHLGRDVPHIACPVGRPILDFRPEVDPVVAAEEGYASFITSERGANRAGDNPYRMRRDHLCAWWGNHQVKYFFSRPWQPRP